MKRVTGIGGIFFKAKDASALQTWYQRHLDQPDLPSVTSDIECPLPTADSIYRRVEVCKSGP